MGRPLFLVAGLSAGSFLAGVGTGSILAGVGARQPGVGDVPASEAEQATIGLFSLTSPFLECQGARDHNRDLARARSRIIEYLEPLKRQDPTLSVSVYARDLLNGPWIGIEERRAYQPASLMKVAVLFHGLARMDSEPGLRERTFLFPGPEAMPSPDNLHDHPAEERMVPGRAYTYEELLGRMVEYSDNHAKDLLLTGVDPAAVDEFMAAVGSPKLVDGGRTVITARGYGALFRILFNSTVFSRPSSEFALSLLTRGRYRGGLRAPLPRGTTVASKFGIHRDPAHPEDGTQLHECGIVYAETGPYVLCMLTASGSRTAEELAPILAEISRIVFLEVQSRG